MPLEIEVLTLFPEMVDVPLTASIPGRIQERGLATIRSHDLREWGIGKHRSVDDAPYGGGAGMVMRPEPVADALDALRRPDSLVILLDPAGEVFRHDVAQDLAERTHLDPRLPPLRGRRRADPRAGRPGAVDRRLRVDRRRAAGAGRHRRSDRLLPGAIDELSTEEESFADGRLEYPQYTRPADVPRRGRSSDPRGW